ncbi:hypothetical protein GCM10023213_23160 [Prosthecobacter algae]|jgi:hypothetical protein|uniref:Uncharacterized protein n=1 Tax=Prosthecobacter algae TaxID=1144682 RepID=A0ABP9P541_9BACT
MNKRVASRRPKSVQALAQEARPARLKQMKSRSLAIQEEIHSLECAIVAAPHTLRRRRMASKDVLPAPEPMFAKKALRSPQRVPLHQLRAAKRRRLALLLEFGVVATSLVAALGWMNQWFHWWD